MTTRAVSSSEGSKAYLNSGSDDGHTPTNPTSTLGQIEAAAQHTMSIHTAATSSIVQQCHQQTQSLFFKLPGEIREIIFSLATQPYLEPAAEWEEPCCRNDRLGEQVTSTSLLATCRRIWLETNHMAFEQANQVFHVGRLQACPRYQRFVESLTPLGRSRLKRLHISDELSHLAAQPQRDMPPLVGGNRVCPEVLLVSVKPFNLAQWAFHQPVRPADRWLAMLLAHQAPPRLREIHLRLAFDPQGSPWAEGHLMRYLRRNHDFVERVDRDGNQVHLSLENVTKDWGRTESIEDRECRQIREYNDTGSMALRTLEFVWRIRVVDEDVGGGLKVAVPGVIFSDAEREPGSPTSSSTAVASNDYWQRKWEAEGSLLKFVE